MKRLLYRLTCLVFGHSYLYGSSGCLHCGNPRKSRHVETLTRNR